VDSEQKLTEELAAALRVADLLVTYVPLSGEPPVSDFLMRHGITTERSSVPPRHDIDPGEFANSLRETYERKDVLIFVPGRKFDTFGTRHGRGGGWYDRFLSQVPREWLRVGVLNESQLSSEPLKRESWDEPMDMLLLRASESWRVSRPQATTAFL
jgi:5-formyltetrahydrofolate cyclo-ligase